MDVSFQVFTRAQIKEAEPSWIWPSDESLWLMPPATWHLIESNPDHPAELPVAATLSCDGHRVATMGLVNQPVTFKDEKHSCVWARALESTPHVRKAGLGGIFMLQVKRFLQKSGITFVSYGATPDAVNLYRELGLVSAGRVPRLVLPIGGNAIARTFMPLPVFSSVAGSLLSAGLKGRAAWLGRNAPAIARQFQFSEAGQDLRWNLEVSNDFARIERSPRTIDWKLDFSRTISGANMRAFTLDDANGAQSALALLRFATHQSIGKQGFRDARVCRVIDLVTDGSEASSVASLCHIINLCLVERIDFIEMVTTDKKSYEASVSLGFIESNGYDLLISPSESLPKELFDIDKWYLNMIESDPAFF